MRDGVRVTTVVPGLMRTGSNVNAIFKGKQEDESGWFGIAAGLPFLSHSGLQGRAGHCLRRPARNQ